MVDFKKLHEDWYNNLDNEARARVDAHRAREARFDETAREIDGHFSRSNMVLNPQTGKREEVLVKEWTSPVKVRIEERENQDGTLREIVAFHRAVTGHEAYHLDESFLTALDECAATGGRFCICAGTPGRWDACHVMADDVLAWLADMRPDLSARQAASPGQPASEAAATEDSPSP